MKSFAASQAAQPPSALDRAAMAVDGAIGDVRERQGRIVEVCVVSELSRIVLIAVTPVCVCGANINFFCFNVHKHERRK